MRVYVNGCPKSGTHAAVRAVELLGLEAVGPEHRHYPSTVAQEGRHICVFRNPRNCLVSMARWRGMPLTAGSLIQVVREYDPAKTPMAAEYAGYLPWRDDPSTLSITYEALVGSPAELGRIAAYLGVPCPEETFEAIPGLTQTWTGAPSNWREHWSAGLQAAWKKAGMVELERRAGYMNG